MANEFHNGDLRCVRTREIGRRLLPVAHDCGVRHLAMEALYDEITAVANRERRLPPSAGYLGQPEMRALIEDALALGWTLLAYETTDPRSPFLAGGGVDWSIVNAREEDQARKLTAALPPTPLVVWCGNSHQDKEPSGDWVPMGHLFRELSGINQFSLDQTVTIADQTELAEKLRADLEPLGGTAGMLVEELPEPFCARPVDALLFSVENELV
jgi:hypothetical protein